MAAILLFSVLQEMCAVFKELLAWCRKCDRLVCDTVYSGRCWRSFRCICPEDGGSMLLQNLAKHLPDCTVSNHRRSCSKHINPVTVDLDRNMKNALHSWAHTLKDTWHLGRQMSHVSVQTKLETVSWNLHYYVQRQVQLLSLLSMNKYIVFIVFNWKALQWYIFIIYIHQCYLYH
jgi:hypothetical protein